MKTSKRIKQGQRERKPVKRIGNGVFETECRSGDHDKHIVHRHDDKFWCDCPAGGLCCHVMDVLNHSASKRNKVPSFWTDPEDQKRQKKRSLELKANGKTFWVTFQAPRKKLIAVRKGWGNNGWELIYRLPNGKNQGKKVDSVDLDVLKERGFQSDGLDWYLK